MRRSIAQAIRGGILLLALAFARPGQAASIEPSGLESVPPTDVLRGAAGQADITPTRPAYLAGYGMNRRSLGIHDPLRARCLVLERGQTRIAFVSCDLIGLPRYQIEKIRASVHEVAPDKLFIAATHTHSGPDTLGQWGRDIQTSGVDAAWMSDTRAKIAALVDETARRLQTVTLKFARTTDLPPVSKNIRVPKILDTELSVMQVLARAGGKPVATLVNFACHPEILNTHQITADFPHWLYDTVETATGAVCLYLNGAQGGMITANYDETTAPKGENWQAAQTIGTALGARTLQILSEAPVLPDAEIAAQRRVFAVPLENPQFRALIALGVFPRELLHNGVIETEASRITIGPAEFLTFPGEVLPNIGLMLKRLQTGTPKFQVGLCGDELGYILAEADYGLDLYAYETRVSVGAQMGPRMVENLRALFPAAAKPPSSSPAPKSQPKKGNP